MLVSVAKSSALLALSLACASAVDLRAQCANEWLSGTGHPDGANGVVQASVLWDPDGAGPATPWLVVGGLFSSVGGFSANNIAAWDPVSHQWHALGSGVNGTVYALDVLPNGDLVVGGAFTTAGGSTANRIASWDGGAWSSLGAGTDGLVLALTVTATGDLIVGGDFTQAGTVAINDLARWDGATWSAFGNVLGIHGAIRALATLPSGHIVAGGRIDGIHGQAMMNVGAWNGTSWYPMAGGLDDQVNALVVMPNGDLYAGGYFTGGVARWRGGLWTGVADPGGVPAALSVSPMGDLIVGGVFSTSAGGVADHIARYDGTSWSSYGSGLDSYPNTITVMPDGGIAAGGWFTSAGGGAASYAAIWNGTLWTTLAGGATAWLGTNGDVLAVEALPNGGYVVGGSFTNFSGVAANHVALAAGGTFTALGGGVNGDVRAIVRLPNGDLVVGGDFDTAGGIPAGRVARWDGSQWTALGGGLLGPSASSVRSLLVLPNGDLLAGGSLAFGVQRWDGSSWVALGAGPGANVNDILRLPNSDILVGTESTMFGPAMVQRWDGSTWSPYGTFFGNPLVSGRVHALGLLPDGDVLASGTFPIGSPTATVMRCRGSVWGATGIGFTFSLPGWLGPHAIQVLANGDAIVAAPGAYNGEHVARYDGLSWHSIDGGMNGDAHALSQLPNGDVLVGGGFLAAGGVVAPYVAQRTSDCPASVAFVGSGCASSAGVHAMQATSLPWIGSTFAATTDGMPAISVAAGVVGFSQIALPVSSVLPQGVSGCTLFAAPDFWSVELPVAGVVTTRLPIPAAVSLIGETFEHQVVAFELAPNGSIVAVTSSNGLSATIGAF